MLEDVQEVPLRERAGEYLMMRLRTAYGISGAEYEKLFLLPFAPLEAYMENLRQHGQALRAEGGRWRLTAEGYLLSNSILSDLLLLQDRSEPLAKRR